jgi:predicted dehydrogenase
MAKQIRKLNVAMIGYGFMGRAHSNAFLQVGHFFDLPYELKLKAMCGRNGAAVEAMAAQWGWEEAQTDWQSVVKRKDIDVVDICAPNHPHAQIAIAAAEAGKIVLCEKPLAMNVAEARQMANAARSLPNLVWFNYRRVPAIALAKELVEQGRVGNLTTTAPPTCRVGVPIRNVREPGGSVKRRQVPAPWATCSPIPWIWLLC